MVVKLNTKQIGLNKAIGVKATVGNTDLANRMLIDLLELNSKFEDVDEGDDSVDTMLQSLKAEREITDKSLAFLQKVLKLDDQQVEKVKNHVDFAGLSSYLNYVCYRIKGMSEEEYRAAMKEPTPKADAPESGAKSSN